MNAQLAGITGPGTAFIAGLITSLHCAGMCGPLACSLMPARAGEGDPATIASIYHVTRLAGYATLGALAGGLGRLPLTWINESVWKFSPWLLVFFFIAVAIRLDQQLPRFPLIGRIYGRLVAKMRGGSRTRAAAALGFATPLLPCGPLYFLLSLALFSGSAIRGAETLLAFGLGTVPLLWFAQANYHLIRVRIGPLRLARARVVLSVVVAAVLVWRLRGTLGLGGPAAGDFVCF